ncbi:hypothetical protein C818_04215 [Lachnospiraceae bacterium MD308]|nr:hypothetical protein C818_04215 [Lachnospiraceae bacterium MD308]
MSNINICAFICKNADEQEQTIKNIMNEIEKVDEEKLSLFIATIINGVEVERDKFYLDYFIRYVCDFEQNNKKGPFTHLFSLIIQKDEMQKLGNKGSQELKAAYKNAFFSTSYDAIKIKFPQKGFYELEVFEDEKEIKGDWRKRYRRYEKDNHKPVSVYSFVVK